MLFRSFSEIMDGNELGFAGAEEIRCKPLWEYKKNASELFRGVQCCLVFGGRKRIRTAVKGFADPCLATRPSDLLRECKYSNKK